MGHVRIPFLPISCTHKRVCFVVTLAEKIEHDLRTRILAGETPPYPLTLSGIAAHFNVSLMPVRRAVAVLIADDFLHQRDNRRLAINPARHGASPGGEPAPFADHDQPERLIEDMIVGMSLRGDETFLREEATADRFDIGRTVVRRIFSRLAGGRMIEHVPRCGWKVRPYREKEMLDYLDLRETLELHALELARDRLDRNVMRKLLAANEPTPDGRPQLDNRLHQHWIDRADNRYLQDFFQQYGIYFQALFDRAVLDDNMVARAAGEHRDILSALLANKNADAGAALVAHIRGQKDKIAVMFTRIAGRS